MCRGDVPDEADDGVERSGHPVAADVLAAHVQVLPVSEAAEPFVSPYERRPEVVVRTT